MRGDGATARAEIYRWSARSVQERGGTAREVLALEPRDVDAGIDMQRVSTELLDTDDPRDRLAPFTPRDPRLGSLVVPGRREELGRLLLRGHASRGSETAHHGRTGQTRRHRHSLCDISVPRSEPFGAHPVLRHAAVSTDGGRSSGKMSAMTKLESDVALSVQQLVDTLADARSTFREVEQFFQRALKKADRGGNLQSALLSPELGLSRQSMNDAVDAIERQRREMRHKLFALAMTEGYSIGEMGRMFGFSRQLASKYARELGND